MNINPFIDLISSILRLYNFVLMVWVIMGWLIALDIINSYQPMVRKVMYVLGRLIDPVLAYLRRYIPSPGGVDLSAIILFLLIGFLRNVLYTYFYR